MVSETLSSSQRDTAIERMLRDYAGDTNHAKQVASLAVRLFDGLLPLHGLGNSMRDLLHKGALLHDIGLCQGASKHHKTSYSLILKSSMEGFTEREKAIVANLARYHRKSIPKRSHTEFATMPKEDQALIRILASFLRIADGLDRTHRSAVREVGCQISGKIVFLTLEGKGLEEEIQTVLQKKRDLFESVFDKQVEMRVKK